MKQKRDKLYIFHVNIGKTIYMFIVFPFYVLKNATIFATSKVKYRLKKQRTERIIKRNINC